MEPTVNPKPKSPMEAEGAKLARVAVTLLRDPLVTSGRLERPFSAASSGRIRFAIFQSRNFPSEIDEI